MFTPRFRPAGQASSSSFVAWAMWTCDFWMVTVIVGGFLSVPMFRLAVASFCSLSRASAVFVSFCSLSRASAVFVSVCCIRERVLYSCPCAVFVSVCAVFVFLCCIRERVLSREDSGSSGGGATSLSEHWFFWFFWSVRWFYKVFHF